MQITKAKRWIWILGSVVCAALAFAFLKRPSPKGVASISRGDVVEAAYGVGTVRADRIYNIKIGTSSRVAERYVRLGDRVKKGDPLILLEGIPLYRAPFNGVVTSLGYNVGELVFNQTNVLVLVNDETLFLQVTLDERTVWSIRAGQEARISFEGQRSKLKIGQVRSVYSTENEFSVVIDFPREEISLLPGMTADVAIQIGVHKNKLRVPVNALGPAGEMTLQRDGKPSEIRVTVGPSDGQFAVVESDQIKEGDQVLLRSNVVKSANPNFP